MCSVWVTVPSARPVEHVRKWAAAWRERGYRVAIWRDPGHGIAIDNVDFIVSDTYPGYARAVNHLTHHILREDTECNWVVTGGDDVYPDSHTADEIALECGRYFWIKWQDDLTLDLQKMKTFGVMQPTGHRWGEHTSHPDPRLRSAYIDRICGSPFMGREFCLRMNKGKGPFHPGFTHMHGDECLFEVAKKLGVLWQRRDLTHDHRHWGLSGNRADMPKFLERWNTPEHWRESKALLDRLKAEDFAECMPI